jgi:hypothetical protein
MVMLCWAAKGGSGTTVVTATLALESERPALLVDLAGEIPAVLGMSAAGRPGVADWLDADGGTNQLGDLLVEIDDTTALLPHREAAEAAPRRSPAGSAADADSLDQRWIALCSWFDGWETAHDGDVWIDGGTGSPPLALAAAVEHRWLVTRACYLSLRRAAACAVRPTGVLLVDEVGRALRPRDIERSVGAPIVGRLPIDPKVARAVDAGLLISRPPLTIRRSLRRVAA